MRNAINKQLGGKNENNWISMRSIRFDLTPTFFLEARNAQANDDFNRERLFGTEYQHTGGVGSRSGGALTVVKARWRERERERERENGHTYFLAS